MLYHHRERVRNGMVDRQELDIECAEPHPLQSVTSRWSVPRIRCSRIFSCTRASELEPTRGISGRSQQVRHRADVVLMTMGQNQRDHVQQPVHDGVQARQDQVDSRMIIFREEHTAVDQQEPAAILQDGHVATDVTETAEGITRTALPPRGGGGFKLLAATGERLSRDPERGVGVAPRA